ncbi:MAG: hypothetical protein GEU75_14730 [Dehalococcoidia bacterium]|nr:hypothetical protein [Dehalococcoidia bacterium]
MRRGRPPYPDLLTPREWEVLALLREGNSNDQIAERLHISRDGAKYHVSEILSKLGVNSRQEAAAWQPQPAGRSFAAFLGVLSLKTAAGSLKLGIGVTAVIGTAAVVFLALGLFVMDQREAVDTGAGSDAGSLGKLAYIQNGDLWVKAVPDGQTLRLTSSGEAAYPQWSPSGDWLLTNRTVLRADASESRVTSTCLAWSPVEDRLACITPDHKLRLEDADGANAVELDVLPLVPDIDSAAVLQLAPYWSPNGDSLAYILDAQLVQPRVQDQPVPGPRYSGLWVVDADGSDAHELLNNQTYVEAGQISVYDWATDDELLLTFNPFFSGSILADGLPLYTISTAGGDPEQVLSGSMLPREELLGGVSSQGQLLLTAGGNRETWTRKRVAVIDLATDQPTHLTDADSAAFSPAWSPDESLIAYASGPDIGNVGGGDVARQGAAQRRIWIANSDGTGKRLLTGDDDFRDERPLWSADGEYVLFARIDSEGLPSIWLVPSSGGEPVKLADISESVAANVTSYWFGFYGYVAWDRYFDWWRGS